MSTDQGAAPEVFTYLDSLQPTARYMSFATLVDKVTRKYGFGKRWSAGVVREWAAQNVKEAK